MKGFYLLVAVIVGLMGFLYSAGYRKHYTNVPMVPASSCVPITGETK
jgi:hypothetical protein